MSNHASELVRALPGLKHHPAMVLRSLAWYADKDTGECYPSLVTLAADSACTKHTVISAIQRLQAAYSDTEPRPLVAKLKGGGKGKPTIYTLNLPLLVELKEQRRKGATPTPFADPVNGIAPAPFAVEPYSAAATPLEDDLYGVVDDFQRVQMAMAKGASSDPYSANRASLYRRTVKNLKDEQVNRAGRADTRAQIKVEALSFRQDIETDLGAIAKQIACAHPSARLRSWTAANVGEEAQAAILEAMRVEAELHGLTLTAAGGLLLGLLAAWDAIPRERWRYIAAIPKFYRQADYRLDPADVQGITEDTNHGSSGVAEHNAAALRELMGGHGQANGNGTLHLEAGGGVRSQAEPEHLGAVHHGNGRADQGGERFGVQPRDGGVSLLPKPVYPPRIQWPRR